MKQIHIFLDKELIKKFKMKVMMEETTMSEVIRKFVEEYVNN